MLAMPIEGKRPPLTVTRCPIALTLLMTLALCLLSSVLGKSHALADETVNVSNPRIVEDASMVSGQVVTWDCVWFGSYPQSEVKSSDEVYANLQSATWDANDDAAVAGQRYRRMRRSATDNYRYFKYEPIKWRVLSVNGNTALVISDAGLDCQPYNWNDVSVTWDTCSVRSWLNGYDGSKNEPGIDYSSKCFAKTAFTDDDMGAIQKVDVPGNEANDWIFILSESEVWESTATPFGFSSNSGINDEARRCKPTDYSKASGLYTAKDSGVTLEGYCYWWVRALEPGSTTPGVFSAGPKDRGGSVTSARNAPRSALYLDLTSASVFSAGTVSSNGAVSEVEPVASGAGGHFAEGFSFETDVFCFQNFGYKCNSTTIGEALSEEDFKLIYSDAVADTLHREKTKESLGGLCFGMSFAVASIFAGNPNVGNIYNVLDNRLVDHVSEIIHGSPLDEYPYSVGAYIFLGDDQSLSSKKKIPINTYLKCNHIYQWSESIARQEERTKNKPVELLTHVKETIDAGQPLVAVNFRQRTGNDAHTVLAIGYEGDDILIYDANQFTSIQRLCINRDNTWSYDTRKGENGAFRSSKDYDLTYVDVDYRPYQILCDNARRLENAEMGSGSFLGKEMTKADDGKALICVNANDYTLHSDGMIPVHADYAGEGQSDINDLYWADLVDVPTLEIEAKSPSSVTVASGGTLITANTEDRACISIGTNTNAAQVAVEMETDHKIQFDIKDIDGENTTTLAIEGISINGTVKINQAEDGYSIEGLSSVRVAIDTPTGSNEESALIPDGNRVIAHIDKESSKVKIVKGSIVHAAVLNVTGWTYDTVEHAINPVVKLGDDTLGAGADYMVSGDTAATNAGEYTVTIIGTGAYTGEKTVSFTVSPKEVTQPTIIADPSNFVYDGTYRTPKVSVKDGEVLIGPNEYDLSITNNLNVGEAIVTVADKLGGNYTINGTGSFRILGKPLDLVVTLEGWMYGETPKNPAVEGNLGGGIVTYEYKSLHAPDDDYVPTIPTTAGTYVVRASIDATGNYAAGNAMATFNIAKATPTLTETPKANEGLVYGESPQQLVSAGSAAGGTLEYSVDGETWTIEPSQATDAGTYQVWYRVVGDANHEDIAPGDPLKVTIAKAEDPALVVPNATATRGGNALNLSTCVSNAKGAVSYAIDGETTGCMVDEGAGTFIPGAVVATVRVRVTIAESENHIGKTAIIEVAVMDKATAELTVRQEDGTYDTALTDPQYSKPPTEGTQTVSYTGTTRSGVQYGPSNAAPTDAGSYTVTVTYETPDTIYLGMDTFSIAPVDLASATVELGSALVYNGHAQTQQVATVKLGTVDVTDLCSVSSNVATDAGSYELVISMNDNGNYTGAVTCPFTVAQAPYSVGVVTAQDVIDDLDPNNVVLSREDTSLEGQLSLDETQLQYGTYFYHWTFAPANENYTQSSGTVEVTVKGHSWNDSTYMWNEDNTSCTAIRTCKNNTNHMEFETVVVKRTVTKEATVDAPGEALLTATFSNSAFEQQTKPEVLPKYGKITSSVTVAGDGPKVSMVVPESMLESLLTDAERALMKGGVDAQLVATITWYAKGEAPKEDERLLAAHASASGNDLSLESLLGIALHLRVGSKERQIAVVDKPIDFTVIVDNMALDSVSKALMEASQKQGNDASVLVRRVHGGKVAEAGRGTISVMSGKARTAELEFSSNEFSTFAIGVLERKATARSATTGKVATDHADTVTNPFSAAKASDGKSPAHSATTLANTGDSIVQLDSVALLGLLAVFFGVHKRSRL